MVVGPMQGSLGATGTALRLLAVDVLVTWRRRDRRMVGMALLYVGAGGIGGGEWSEDIKKASQRRSLT